VRDGEWQNLNYAHQLSHGARRIATHVTEPKLIGFHEIATNLLDDDQYANAHDLIRLIRQTVRTIESGFDGMVRQYYDYIPAVGRCYVLRTLHIAGSKHLQILGFSRASPLCINPDGCVYFKTVPINSFAMTFMLCEKPQTANCGFRRVIAS
jgi:hypothetical protein